MEIKDFSEKTVEDCLQFFYGNKLTQEEFTPELLLIAEKYDVKQLLKDCQEALANQMDSETVFDILKVAFLANQEGLMKKSRDFLLKKPSLFISNEWVQLLNAYPSLCDSLRNLK